MVGLRLPRTDPKGIFIFQHRDHLCKMIYFPEVNLVLLPYISSLSAMYTYKYIHAGMYVFFPIITRVPFYELEDAVVQCGRNTTAAQATSWCNCPIYPLLCKKELKIVVALSPG